MSSRPERLFRTQSAAWVAIAIAALAISLPGLGSLPIDKHEALVARTSAEMLERGELIIPYFNGEPRLNKPPLSYWATIAVHQLRAGTDDPIGIVDARLPSLAAMFGILGLVISLARRAAGSDAAMYSSAIAVASPMLAFFSHDARPDPMYAFLTFAGAVALARPLFQPAGRPDRIAMPAWTWIGWLLWGLATLTKGPHMPLMVGIGLFIFGMRELGDWRLAWQRLRPFAGLAFMGLVALPWWWMLHNRLDARPLAESQLSGTLYRPGVDSLGYSYRELLGVGLIFPWFLLIAVYFREALALLRVNRIARMCAWGYLTPLVLMMFSPQHRWHYMLPVVPFLVVFCGLLARRLGDRPWFKPAFASIFAALALLLSANAGFLWFWDAARFERQKHLAPLAAPGLQNIPLLATPSIESTFTVAVATAGRSVQLIHDHSELHQWEYETAATCVILLTTDKDLERISPSASLQPLATWNEHGSRLLLHAAGRKDDCIPVVDAYRQSSRSRSAGLPE